MVGYTYSTYKTALAEMLVYDPTDADFVAILPSVIDYAEQRIYRELDLLSTVVRDTGTLTIGNRSFTLPTNVGLFVVVDGINVITPTGQAPDSGTRNPLASTTRDYIDMVYGTSATGQGQPLKFCMLTQETVLVGPSPDAAYTMEVIGTQRPEPLSESNTTTFLSQYLPDLFMAASMVFGSGFIRNFGQQSSDPAMGTSWEAQYSTLFDSALVEETRKKFWTEGWNSKSPSPLATPKRD